MKVEYVVSTPTRATYEAVMKKAVKLGLVEREGHKFIYGKEHCINVLEDAYSPAKFYTGEKVKIISAKSFLSKRIPKKLPPIDVVLNKNYTATVDRNSKIVMVGCQEIPFSAVKSLYKAITSK